METIIITGAGTGIGAATARRLSKREGTRLILLGRRAEPLLKLGEELGGDHLVRAMDVADRQAWEALFADPEVNLALHPLRGLFANAGIGGPNAFDAPEGDRWDEIIRVNLTGVYVSGEACKPHFDASAHLGARHLVVTSSVLARFGVPGQPAYVASKTGLLGLVRSWAVAWSRSGLLVNAICPGWVNTEMAQASIQSLAQQSGRTYEAEVEFQAELLPTGRLSEPSEIAAAVTWLMSDEQRSMTGQAIDINNGSFMM